MTRVRLLCANFKAPRPAGRAGVSSHILSSIRFRYSSLFIFFSHSLFEVYSGSDVLVFTRVFVRNVNRSGCKSSTDVDDDGSSRILRARLLPGPRATGIEIRLPFDTSLGLDNLTRLEHHNVLAERLVFYETSLGRHFGPSTTRTIKRKTITSRKSFDFIVYFRPRLLRRYVYRVWG